MNDSANFQTVSTAFLTLIRISTGENWPKLLEAISRENQPGYECIDNPTFIDYANNNCKSINTT